MVMVVEVVVVVDEVVVVEDDVPDVEEVVSVVAVVGLGPTLSQPLTSPKKMDKKANAKNMICRFLFILSIFPSS